MRCLAERRSARRSSPFSELAHAERSTALWMAWSLATSRFADARKRREDRSSGEAPDQQLLVGRVPLEERFVAERIQRFVGEEASCELRARGPIESRRKRACAARVRVGQHQHPALRSHAFRAAWAASSLATSGARNEGAQRSPQLRAWM
ncbi:MAG: hypothetical protein IPN34_08925 [Planctomycetes bacterium]|nr:hypothetical protein [Planctomycetota bacterium]